MGESAMSDIQTVGDVLTQLVAEGYIDALPENPPFNADDDTPPYIKALLGFGGWIAALFFFAFVGLCVSTIANMWNIFTIGFILCVIGAILMGVTILVRGQDKG